jgi:hypothetical protein
MNNFIRIFSFLILTTTVCSISANAQQTIFNVPSSDVLDKGKVYFELDSTFRFDNTRNSNKFSSLVPRVVVGTGGNVEVGLNLTGNINPGTDATALVPAIKWRAYSNEESGVSIVVGDNVIIPVRNKSYNIGNYAYAQVSKTIKSTNGTRLTVGGYYFTKNVVSTAARAGGQFGFEQPVNKYLNINADWYTGKNAAGYFTPGVAFKPHPRVTGYVGYSIGNDNPRSNNFFYAAVGVNLN